MKSRCIFHRSYIVIKKDSTKEKRYFCTNIKATINHYNPSICKQSCPYAKIIRTTEAEDAIIENFLD